MALNDSLDISYQTIYAELAQRSLDETFASEFSSNGRFVAVDVKGKKYWYFDTPRPGGGPQERRYVGPTDDPEITRRVEAFKDLKADIKTRRSLVSTLTRQAHLPRPPIVTGNVVEALAKAGFFRLRGVLVGTVAYQCYSAILARRLDSAIMQTGDADFAQFQDVSVAVGDSLPPILEVLRTVDPTFREIPSQTDGRFSTQFVSRDKFKVEFLTPNRGSADNDGKPVKMPALGGAAAFPLRFLDYLIYQPVRARVAARRRRPRRDSRSRAIRRAQTHRRIQADQGARHGDQEREGPSASARDLRCHDQESPACRARCRLHGGMGQRRFLARGHQAKCFQLRREDANVSARRTCEGGDRPRRRSRGV